MKANGFDAVLTTIQVRSREFACRDRFVIFVTSLSSHTNSQNVFCIDWKFSESTSDIQVCVKSVQFKTLKVLFNMH